MRIQLSTPEERKSQSHFSPSGAVNESCEHEDAEVSRRLVESKFPKY